MNKLMIIGLGGLGLMALAEIVVMLTRLIKEREHGALVLMGIVFLFGALAIIGGLKECES